MRDIGGFWSNRGDTVLFALSISEDKSFFYFNAIEAFLKVMVGL
jgi:hypothetical protein